MPTDPFSPGQPSSPDDQPPATQAPGAQDDGAQDNIATRGQLAAQVQHLSHLSKTLSGEKQFLRAVLDSLEDAIVAFDPHGSFVLCNGKFETLFGLTANELSGHDEPWLRQRLRERLEAPETFWQPIDGNATVREEIVRLVDRRRSKPYVLNWYWGPVLDESGDLAGHISVQRDITRETEVDQMKTDFISIVSHELRTPMTSIRGYVDLILDGDTGEINDLQRQFLKTVQRNTLRLTAMVNDMLDISRIEDGGIELDWRDLSLGNLIDQVTTEARFQIESKGLALNVVCHDENGNECDMPRVRSDHDRLMQVLTNLLSNAIKYTPPPPDSPGQIVIDVLVSELKAQVSVRDTGIGISEEDVAMLFQKFFRADNPQTRDVDGTGLGLSITRSIVEKMGGDLQVHSRPGQGSDFSFSLPLATPAPLAAPKTAPDSAKNAVPSAPPQDIAQEAALLIVTANADNAAAEKKVWMAGGDHLAVSIAYSGSEAIRHLETMANEAVLVDPRMPHGDAFRLIRFLDTHQPGTPTAPLQNRRTGKTVAAQPWFTNLPAQAVSALQKDLASLIAANSTALVVSGGNPLSPTPALTALRAALRGNGVTVAPVHSIAEALAALQDKPGQVSALAIDLSNESEDADEQTLQLLETIGLEAIGKSTSPLVFISCKTYLLACSWPAENSVLQRHFQEFIDRDRQYIWSNLQMAT